MMSRKVGVKVSEYFKIASKTSGLGEEVSLLVGDGGVPLSVEGDGFPLLAEAKGGRKVTIVGSRNAY